MLVECNRCHQNLDRQPLKADIDADSGVTNRELAIRLRCWQHSSERTIINALHDIEKVCKQGRWIPFKLIENHKIHRMVTSQSMLAMAKKVNFLDSISPSAKNRGARLKILTQQYSSEQAPSDNYLLQSHGTIASYNTVNQHSTSPKMSRWFFCLQANSDLRYRVPKPTRKMRKHNSFTGEYYID